MGVAQAINAACIQSYKEGIVRSVEVIVPGPWFLDATRLLKENPGLDVGVHLCLTSEWERCKWGPITSAPSLVDENGYFFPTTRQRTSFPPNTSFLGAKPKIEEVEKELRAQIETARRHISNLSHLSAHMGTATSSPELRGLVNRLANEYGLPLQVKGLKRAGGFSTEDPKLREEKLAVLLKKLGLGTWLLIEHPGFDTPELRAMGHKGYENVAADRAAVTRAFTSKEVRQLILDRGIQLINYAEVINP